ncbi:MAG: hypothetical protein UX80_C0019G0013 [Candidatus Amesbacteria bacterium GW2011_GWA2_47_11b]|uniref:PIN domain-containing protein n=3 Tax=Candidatus Amesiibacteriota TaxID=1752730 RepID=A0A0G1SEM6_9BACT|nr:MAG: hypothetical protein UX42_C0003G0080 [Microgenomates group bacterium GW2011_GWC1_46_20]KKU57321.1 MAG: hypothetical protein UX80_C0019G0013 [Candidatus Amesbacteria bacterium GW2011_GWA2_47_11b]KKU67871.1 MAG: hypothetical protein UX92_C0028G0003 [Candidatus Amesbacteria bacterium GW2011_GWA1_47_20]KKU83431.1 MAG: hypothetical protein UY11_C0020G0013 [Candidatus Amesbacteria bacterium GW2011_GWC2_47_8]
MIGVFIDSSVLVAASGSKTGASALVLGYSRSGQITGVVSPDVVREAQKNVLKKMGPEKTARLDQYLRLAKLDLIPTPSQSEIDKCKQIIVDKDAPILAACLASQTNVLVTLDFKHMLKPKIAKFLKPTLVLTPHQLVLLIENRVPISPKDFK